MLPVDEVTRPACLGGQQNGELDRAILVPTPGLAGGPTVTLVEPAARSWRAMATAALTDGITLKATSTADSYRTLAQQIQTFRERYTRDSAYDYRPYRRWDSDGNGYAEYWYQLPNTAVAAVPGTSNHGLGLAVDVAGAGAPGPILSWLLAHAHTFGWSWETQSESWHIRYCTGDAIPAAVLAYEQGDDMDYNQSQKLDAVFNLFDTIKLDTDQTPDGRGTTAIFQVPLTVFLKGLMARLDAQTGAILKAIAEVSGGSADVVAIISDLHAYMDKQKADLEAEVRDAVADLGEGGSAQVRADA